LYTPKTLRTTVYSSSCGRRNGPRRSLTTALLWFSEFDKRHILRDMGKNRIDANIFSSFLLYNTFPARLPPRPLLVRAYIAFGLGCGRSSYSMVRWIVQVVGARLCTTLTKKTLFLPRVFFFLSLGAFPFFILVAECALRSKARRHHRPRGREVLRGPQDAGERPDLAAIVPV